MRRIGLVMAVALVAAACGGEEAASTSTATADPPSASSSDAASDDPSPDEPAGTPPGTDEPAPAPVAESRASITLDGTTHEFAPGDFPQATCDPDAFGYFGVTMLRVDDAGETVTGDLLGMTLLPPGIDPEDAGFDSLITVTIDGTTWSADPMEGSLTGAPPPGTGRVDEVTIEGSRASGSATFFDLDLVRSSRLETGEAEIVTAPGSFEVACAE